MTLTPLQLDAFNSTAADLLDPLLAPCSNLDQLAYLADFSEYTRDLAHAAVHRARLEGSTWAAIGDALGVSPQAAQQRFGR